MSKIERAVIRELRAAGFTVLTRKQWGSKHRAQYQWRRVHRHFVGPADHMFAHITVTNDDGDLVGDFKADCREVERIGQQRFGTGASYNWLVDQESGTIAVAMPHDAAGAHTLNDKNVPGFHDNLNYWGHAIAWIGVPSDRVSRRALDAYAAIIAAEKKHGAAKNGADLYPHSKFAAKDCPCDQVRDEIPTIERRSRRILGADTGEQKRRQRRQERRAARKRERRQERRQAARQRRRERRRKIARGDIPATRTEQAAALVRLAFNLAHRKGWKNRMGELREVLRELRDVLPKK